MDSSAKHKGERIVNRIEMILNVMDEAYAATGLDSRNASNIDLQRAVVTKFGAVVRNAEIAEAKDAWGTMDADLEDGR